MGARRTVAHHLEPKRQGSGGTGQDEARTLTVRETVVRGRRGAIGIGEPKSAAGRRTLAAPAGLMAMLSDHMAEKGLAASDEEALLFTAPGGGFLRYSKWVRRSWYPAAVAAVTYGRPSAAEQPIDSRSIGPAEDGAGGAACRPGLFAPGASRAP